MNTDDTINSDTSFSNGQSVDESTHNGEQDPINSYEDLSFATKRVYESYLELLNHKAKTLLIKQFKRDLRAQVALGFIFLALFFGAGAFIWGFSDQISPVLSATLFAVVFLALAGFFVWKGFFAEDKAKAKAALPEDDELKGIHATMARETYKLSEAMNDKEANLMGQINPIEIVTQKVKEHPTLSLGAAALLGLFAVYKASTSDDHDKS